MKSTRNRVLSLAVGLALIGSAGARAQDDTQNVGPYKDFKGVIKLDIRDSTADWGPFTPKKAPAGAPNILFVLYDDGTTASEATLDATAAPTSIVATAIGRLRAD